MAEIGRMYSCLEINQYSLSFNGRIDQGGKCISLCCEKNAENVPSIKIGETGKQTIESFMKMYEEVVAESTYPTPKGKKRIFTNGCVTCANYQLAKKEKARLIQRVNLSFYPSPCQCRCFYCDVPETKSSIEDKSITSKCYTIVFDALEYALKTGLIAPNAFWQISPGEITIHPYKDRILDLVNNQAAWFLTNCFKFDEKIGKNLSENPRSGILLSIDAGMPETWLKVKGVDNFNDVISNLSQYHRCAALPSQINLKYIVLPGINDSYQDYAAVIELMKSLGVRTLLLSPDYRFKYKPDDERRRQLITSTGRLVDMLSKNNLTTHTGLFSSADAEQIELFKNNQNL